jgi:hypothetical protein
MYLQFLSSQILARESVLALKIWRLYNEILAVRSYNLAIYFAAIH